MKIAYNIKKLIQDFIYCGLIGLLIEVLFTGIHSAKRRLPSLESRTSLTMFPIYGCAALIHPLSKLLHKIPAFFRGLLYMSMIFTGEYTSGKLLQRKQRCPWDYSRSKYHIGSIIRLDYSPYWFMTGLLFESLLNKRHSEH